MKIKRSSRPSFSEQDTLVTPSTPMLEQHFVEILEAVEAIHNLSGALRVIPLDDKNRDEYEGRLYAALTHLDHHVKPAIKCIAQDFI